MPTLARERSRLEHRAPVNVLKEASVATSGPACSAKGSRWVTGPGPRCPVSRECGGGPPPGRGRRLLARPRWRRYASDAGSGIQAGGCACHSLRCNNHSSAELRPTCLPGNAIVGKFIIRSALTHRTSPTSLTWPTLLASRFAKSASCQVVPAKHAQ
jgi:hypothetical protein